MIECTRETARRAAKIAPVVAALVALAAPVGAQSAADIVYVGGRYAPAANLDDRAGKREDAAFTAALTPPSIALARQDRLGVGAIYRFTGIHLTDNGALAGEPSW